VGLVFPIPIPRRSFSVAVIDGTLQISKLPLSFALLLLFTGFTLIAFNHLALDFSIPFTVLFRHRVHRTHPLPELISLLPSLLLPIFVKSLELGDAWIPRQTMFWDSFLYIEALYNVLDNTQLTHTAHIRLMKLEWKVVEKLGFLGIFEKGENTV
jgi:hypothetical protein